MFYQYLSANDSTPSFVARPITGVKNICRRCHPG